MLDISDFARNKQKIEIENGDGEVHVDRKTFGDLCNFRLEGVNMYTIEQIHRLFLSSSWQLMDF